MSTDSTGLLVPLTHPIPADLAGELSRRVFFVDDRITGFSPVIAGDVVTGVRVTTDRPVTATELAAKVDLMVVSDLLDRLANPEVVRWRSRRSSPPARPVFEDMLADGLAIVAGDGQVAVAKPVLDLMDRLDTLIADIARAELSAVEYRYPTLLNTSVLRRSGYVTSFPHHLMYATRLRADIHNYRDFLADASTTADFARTVLAHSDNVDLCLPPTMCYHTFQQFADSRLPTANMVVTARGQSFRYEGRYHSGLERLWDFTIRETVFLGSRDFAADCRDAMRRRTCELVDHLGLTGHCEVANDPFFGNTHTGKTISAQRMLERKHELRLAVAPDRTIAVGSFNLHDKLFSSAFGIELPDGGPVYTACTGFGLERLAYAVLCQHGLDESDWPQALRSDHDDREGKN